MVNIKTKTQIVDEENGLMIRVDKSLKEMMEEKPFSRWNATYWHPTLEAIIKDLRNSKFQVKSVSDFFSDDGWLISTDHVRASRGELEGDNYPVEYYTPDGFMFTGYRTYHIPHCTENAYIRMKRAKPLSMDLLLGGFGMGPTGKSLVLWQQPEDKAIVGNIFILRTKDKYNPFLLDVIFKSKYGQAQFKRFKAGVAFYSLSNDEIKSLMVPIFPEKIIESVKNNYLQMTKYHDKAMRAKKQGNENVYKENIEIAERVLRDLIEKTEQVITGKKDDVV